MVTRQMYSFYVVISSWKNCVIICIGGHYSIWGFIINLNDFRNNINKIIIVINSFKYIADIGNFYTKWNGKYIGMS